jgi:hypothetical protein
MAKNQISISFRKIKRFSEAEFMTFRHYRSLEKKYLKYFREDNQITHKDNDYAGYDMKTKMLSFYFTFFGANRSYVTMSLKV